MQQTAEALVIMGTVGAAKKAIAMFKGADVNGRTMKVHKYQF